MEQNLNRLCRTLDYEFKNLSLLKQALTHRSAHASNNERLEFLGDSLLSTVIANALFHQYPEESEGQLSRLRAHLVRGDTLTEVAQDLALGDCLYLGQGELKSGGFRRASILADALEAIFAAIFIDSDFTNCQRVILKLFKPRLNDNNLNENLKDAKTRLQEYLQAKKRSLPLYTLDKIVGETHEQVFHVTCKVDSLDLRTEGQGPTRRKAEQQAADRLFQQLREVKS